MQYVFQLSKEHDLLPRLEVEAVLNTTGETWSVAGHAENLLTIETRYTGVKLFDRLALTHEVCRVHETIPLNSEPPTLQNVPQPTGSFAVRVTPVSTAVKKRHPGYRGWESRIAAQIKNSSKAPVDLDAPDTFFRCYLHQDELVLTERVANIDRHAFENRANQYRPFKKPVSLHPKHARLLVNLAEVSPGDTVLDPLCGTGGILLEAGLIGCRVVGADIDGEMVEGARENLAHFAVDAVKLLECNVNHLETCLDETVDAVVADLPYGVSSKTTENIEQAFLQQARKLCAGKIVCMSNKDALSDGENTYEPVAGIYQHKNLTRYIYVLAADA